MTGKQLRVGVRSFNAFMKREDILSSAPVPCCPSLDCSNDDLVAYIRSMKGGERVMEMGRSCMTGCKGTVEIRDGRVCIRWDHQEYADGAGAMVTSFTGGARIIQDNDQALHQAGREGATK